MTRPAPTRRLGGILLLLAAALVFVQVLGMMHAVLHDHARVGPQASSATATPDRAADDSVLGALFSQHDSQADCDRFDHITHADPAWFVAPQFAPQRPDRVEVAVHAGWHVAQQAAGFLARGPPSQA